MKLTNVAAFKKGGHPMRNPAWIIITALLSLCGVWGCSGAGGDSATNSTPGPAVTSVLPQANFNQVGLTDPVSASFDANMSAALPGTFVVHGYQTGRLTGTYSGGGSTTLNFVSADSFRVGEEIEVSLTGGLTSMVGDRLEAPFVYRFRVEASGGTGTFVGVQTVSVQFNAVALAAGDWDSDGTMDLAVANFGSNSVSILKNDGTGVFVQSSAVANQIGATAIVTGDWDGDGDLDLAVANFGANSISLLINDGSGFFSVVRAVSGQQGAKGLAVGDWDGDGALDLAVANSGSDSVAILFNNGAGIFTVSHTVGGQQNAAALASGDWDNDGDLDLAVANFGSNSVAFLENDGAGVFTVADTVGVLVGARALAAGDYDNDGDLDLAVANSSVNQVAILENDGAGIFTVAGTVAGQTGATALVAGDWDADGDLDLAVANSGLNTINSIAVLENDGTGAFVAAGTIAGQVNASALAAGDWNGDGALDLASANNGDRIDVLENQP